MDEQRRLVGFILARILLITLLLIATLTLRLQSHDSPGWDFSRFLWLQSAAYAVSLLSLVVSWCSARLRRSLAYLQIFWDILFVTLLLLITGGIGSPFSFLYLLAIINASVLLARREAFYTASLCGILYGALVDLQFYGYLAPLGLSQEEADRYDAGYLFYTLFITIAAYYLVALLSGYLAERARRSEHDLEQSVSEIEELTRLHSAIVGSMESGLMTLDPDRSIKVFNACAERLTGMRQSDVYGRRLDELFPELAAAVTTLRVRAETSFTGPAGTRILSCLATPLADREGVAVGIIITFQDVTELKQMEAELQRADRLAAVGELSARIAHEIRNPLAAISGSVQLISRQLELSGEERQLFDIVMRESDRLNTLIGDFLAYARPRPPRRLPVPLRRIVDDLRVLLRSDHRFGKIAIILDADDPQPLWIDADQFTQLLWNLFVNAADAMPDGGTITVTRQQFAGNGTGHAWDEITVADTGRGLSSGELSRLFEPFVSTKQGGSGLGLATVYRIVGGHGGQITVESAPDAGTRFHICIPQER